MGFVNLPVEGDPVARLPEVLDQIQAALAEDDATNVRRIGNRIEFTTDSLMRRWLFTGRFRTVSSGEIEAEASSDSLMIDYRLSFFELLVVLTAMALLYLVVIPLRSGLSLTSTLGIVLFFSVVSFGANIATTAFKFSRFLRQFPREAESFKRTL
jgi:hypothetical protein